MEDLPEEQSKGEQDHRSFIATTMYSSFLHLQATRSVKCSSVSMAEF